MASATHSDGVVDAASSMFQSNIQCMAYILALKRELASLSSRHEEELALAQGRIEALMEILTSQQDRLEHLKSALSLKELWTRLLAFHSVGSSSLQGWNEIEVEGQVVTEEQSHAATALSLLSVAVVQEVETGTDSLVLQLLSKVQKMETTIEAELKAQGEEIFQLRAVLDEKVIRDSLDERASRSRERRLKEELERARLEAEDLGARAVRAEQEREAAEQAREKAEQRARELEERLAAALEHQSNTAPLALSDLDSPTYPPSSSPSPSPSPSPHAIGAVQPTTQPPAQAVDLSVMKHVMRQRYARGEVVFPLPLTPEALRAPPTLGTSYSSSPSSSAYTAARGAGSSRVGLGIVSPDAPLSSSSSSFSSFSDSSSSTQHLHHQQQQQQQHQQKVVTFADGPASAGSSSDKENVSPAASIKSSNSSKRGKVTPPSSRVPVKGSLGLGLGKSNSNSNNCNGHSQARVVSIDLDLDEVLGNLDDLALVSAALRELEGL